LEPPEPFRSEVHLAHRHAGTRPHVQEHTLNERHVLIELAAGRKREAAERKIGGGRGELGGSAAERRVWAEQTAIEKEELIKIQIP
ncbi:hypothetical protein X777_09967, partial [Ooceraea biroi]